ncbi:hypothetical protein [Actinomadura kijaniata]|uniref:hypothetical protein n=1 Tax=Actinomadura kijaniata TaxID=46161 RepID=UPI0008319907|nr:hypothetical protein [Actinomadura kijaniata]
MDSVSGIAFYAAALPLVAALAADQELFAAYQRANRDRGSGPHVALDDIARYLRECRKAGELPPGAEPHTLALTLCGTAQFEAYTEYLAGPDALPGGRADRLAAAADLMLSTGGVPAATSFTCPPPGKAGRRAHTQPLLRFT